MISVTDAQAAIRNLVRPLATRTLALSEAAGLVLGADIYAAEDIPAFPQSSVDGYALCFSDWTAGKELLVGNGEPDPSNSGLMLLRKGEAMRIFSGAPLPAGADTVVVQEKASRHNRYLQIEDPALKKGDNLRPRGAEIRAGEMALGTGTLLQAAALGLLAGIGVARVPVTPAPKVHLIITGRELQDPGFPLGPGQVYESNSVALVAALEKEGIYAPKISRAADDLGVITEILRNSLGQADLILISGGISVGDYDFVLEASQRCGVSPVFHRVRQRPGRPLFCGSLENKWVFGLPGNPSSVLTCFYEYVLPALGLLKGRKTGLQERSVPLQGSIDKPAGLTYFLKGFFDGQGVRALDTQESFRLHSFARANCLILAPDAATHFEAGSAVIIHLLPVY